MTTINFNEEKQSRDRRYTVNEVSYNAESADSAILVYIENGEVGVS